MVLRLLIAAILIVTHGVAAMQGSPAESFDVRLEKLDKRVKALDSTRESPANAVA